MSEKRRDSDSKESGSNRANRRAFLGTSAAVGAGLLAGCTGGGGLIGGSSSGGNNSGGQTSATMTYATPYTLDAEQYVPIMQPEFKQNVESATNGDITVELAPGGQLGTGTDLAQKVQQGTIEAAQISLSNFSPFASAVDLINMPYFAGTNQEFVNLATSDIWQERIESSVQENGYKVAYYIVVDPRSIATAPGFPPEQTPPLAPQDMQGVKHRIPGSDLLQTAWNLVGANPSPIDWSETPTALEEGVAESTHNAPNFHPAFGFTDIITNEVPLFAVVDAQVAAMNRQWYRSLSSNLQDSLDQAAEQTFKQNLERVAQTRQNAYDTLTEAGVKYHALDDGQIKRWQDAMGYQRPEWEQAKKDLAGSLEEFKQFEQATGQKSDYNVSELDVSALKSS